MVMKNAISLAIISENANLLFAFRYRDVINEPSHSFSLETTQPIFLAFSSIHLAYKASIMTVTKGPPSWSGSFVGLVHQTNLYPNS